MNTTRLAALAVTLTGIATLITAALLFAVPGAVPLPATSDHASKFTNTILWFELAKDADEVIAVLGPSDDPEGIERREIVDEVNRWDFGFMVAYSSFFGALVVFVWTLNRDRRFWNEMGIVGVGVMLAVMMLAGDVLENRQLLRLTGYASSGDIPAAIMRDLNLWTRVKWGAIFAESVLLAWGYAVYFLRPGVTAWRQSGLVIAFFFAVTALIGFPSLLVDSVRYWLETASLVLVPAWLLSLAHGTMAFVNGGRSGDGDTS